MNGFSTGVAWIDHAVVALTVTSVIMGPVLICNRLDRIIRLLERPNNHD